MEGEAKLTGDIIDIYPLAYYLDTGELERSIDSGIWPHPRGGGGGGFGNNPAVLYVTCIMHYTRA